MPDWVPIVGVGLGLFAVVLDLGGRLLGPHVRHPWGTTWRIAVLVLLGLGMLSPLAVAAAAPDTALARFWIYTVSATGALLFLGYVLGVGSGLRKHPLPAAEELELTKGIHLRKHVLTVPRLPEEQNGLSLLVISDLHCNSPAKLHQLRRAIRKLSEGAWDCVVILGDFGERDPLLPRLISLLGRIPSRYGSFCVRGNHDLGRKRGEALRRLLEKRKIMLLDDRLWDVPETRLTLVGMERSWRRQDAPRLPAERFVIALTHVPDNMRTLHRHAVDFVLAGHTHGGRRRLPVFGPLLVASRLGRLVDRGLYSRGGTLMFVTEGVGYWPGVLGEQGEIAHVMLRRPAVVP